jgi:hypothetical protein
MDAYACAAVGMPLARWNNACLLTIKSYGA